MGDWGGIILGGMGLPAAGRNYIYFLYFKFNYLFLKNNIADIIYYFL